MSTRSLSSPKSVVRTQTAPVVVEDVPLLAQPVDGRRRSTAARLVQRALGEPHVEVHVEVGRGSAGRLASWEVVAEVASQRDGIVGVALEQVGRGVEHLGGEVVDVGPGVAVLRAARPAAAASTEAPNRSIWAPASLM